jgi:hypothetical protein
MKKNITVGFMTKLNHIGGVMIKVALLFCAVDHGFCARSSQTKDL